MNTFYLQLQTPDKIVFDEKVVGVTSTAYDGVMTVLGDHQNIVTRLEVCVVKIDFEDGKSKQVAINGGTMSFRDNTLLISTIEAQEIDSSVKDTKAVEMFPKSMSIKNEDIQKQVDDALKLGGYYQPDQSTTSLLAEERLAKMEMLRELI
jgi:F-type H+-transporting ATPase subunit epsilon